MDVAGPYPITSTENHFCLMVGCYFSKWLEGFPRPDQNATTEARKLVYEIVARYEACRELHSNQGTNFGSKVVLDVCRFFGIHKTRTTTYRTFVHSGSPQSPWGGRVWVLVLMHCPRRYTSRPLGLPGEMPWPRTPAVATLGWPAPASDSTSPL